eukprot:NODE_11694_length_539_cov_72.968750_g11406_i0.p1 GENE.NODE_11694_length_539_cov_72.968750_g11406_i0~~NODE_11694_length_539_cov_72.968750_g11406_i0.p1  ORF type:complete len:107 (+),score=10.24 NODE_11694_length_539_cov_72.968750_g11406_i0:54-374(+)
MLFHSFEAFVAESERLFRESPTVTRYSVKFRHCEGCLVLKVTDNVSVITYKTKDQQDVKNVDRLTNAFMHHFCDKSLAESQAEIEAAERKQAQSTATSKGKRKGKK